MRPTRPASLPSCILSPCLSRTQAGGARAARTLAALLAILIASLMVSVSSARAVELEEFTWSAAGAPAFPTWSDPLNWKSDTAPTPFSTVGLLSFPAQENSTCALDGGGEECYINENDVPGLTAESLSINDGYSYRIKGESITLGAGGLTATTSATSEGYADLYFPIVLGSSQTWTIDGNEDHGGLATYNSVTGTSALEVNLTGGAYFEPENIETGPITISGNGSVSLGKHYADEGLNSTDGNPVTLKGATLVGENGTVGPLTSIGGELALTAQSVTALSVAGEVTLDSASSVQEGLSQVPVNLVQAGDEEWGYGRLEATGNVNLGGARFIGIDASTEYGECPRLNPGNVYALIKSDGSIEGTFAGTPDGTVLSVYCGGGVTPTVRINYTRHTVTATAVTPGEPRRPASISSPSIKGNAVEGQTLTDVHGTWTGSPTAFSYQWEDCYAEDMVCLPIAEATEQSYTLRGSDLGYKVRVHEVAENSYGPGGAAYSPRTAIVSKAVPSPSVVSPPSIQGSAAVGQTLTEVHGLWTGSPTSYSYLWERCEIEGRCSAIPGATGQTYSVQAADVGYTIMVQETARNAGGPSSPASSAETGIVPPLAAPGGGGGNGGGNPGGGNGGGGGNSGGGNAGGGSSQPQAPQVTSVSSPIGSTKLPGGPVSGGTQLTITGSGFVPGATQVWIEPYGQSATSVAVQSSTQLTAVTPNVPMIVAGKHTIRVNTPAGSSSPTASAANSFYYYVPQIGTLIYRDPSLSPTDRDYISQCTASVVSSSNGDIALTAGHCVTSGETWHDEVIFAPGYYGSLCGAKKYAWETLCGVAPYSWWYGRTLFADTQFREFQLSGEAKGLDYGFVLLETQGGISVQQAVGGGLRLTFCQGRHSPKFPTCDARSGSQEHNWTPYGEPVPTQGVAHCGPGGQIGTMSNPGGPELLTLIPCSALIPGSSGGPWITSANTVGAVNQGQGGNELLGAYLGEEASETFNIAQTNQPVGIGVTNQDASVSGSGVVGIPVTCPSGEACQGAVLLTYQGAVAAQVARKTSRRPKGHLARLGRAHFSLRAGQAAMIHVHLTAAARKLLRKHRSLLPVNLTIQASDGHRATMPLTLRGAGGAHG